MSSQKAGISFGIFQNQAFIQEVWLNPGWCCDLHVLFVISALGRSRHPVQVHELHMSNMQNMSNMKNMSNRQNILNMDKLSLKSNLVHKIVYLALCSLLLVLGVTKDGSSSSSVSSTCAGPSRRTRSRLPSPGWRPPPQCPAPPPQHPRTAPPPPPHPGRARGEPGEGGSAGGGAGWTSS
jgi:hypothetical protein